jgi:hypothetical protein
MLIPCVLAPTIFNFDELKDLEQKLKLNQIILLFRTLQSRGIILFDNKDFLISEIKQNILNINNDNIKKQLETLLINMYKKFKIKKIEVIPSTEDIQQYCQYFTSIAINNDAFGFFANADCTNSCTSCLSENFQFEYFKSLDCFESEDFSNIFSKKSFLSTSETDVNDLKQNILKNFIIYANELYIYDKQLTPDIDAQNIGSEKFKIPTNFEYNLKYWLLYFYEINPTLNISIIVSIKEKQANIEKDIIDMFEKFKSEIILQYPDILLNFKYIKKPLSSLHTCVNLLHQRYFCTENAALSCDRGIDLLKRGQTIVRDFHISIVEFSDEIKLKQYFKDNIENFLS